MTKLGHCRFCQSTNFIKLFDKYGYEVVKCQRCGLIFLNFNPTAEFITDYYGENFFNDPGTKHGFKNYERERDTLQKTFSERIEVIKRERSFGKLLDIGCATGIFLEEATKYWDAYGVEISTYAANIAKNKNLNVFAGELHHCPYLKLRFDIVTLWDTIEHLNDPAETVKKIGAITAPGGFIFLTTGDVESLAAKLSGKFWHLYNIPQHLSFFSPKTIGPLLWQGGFKIRKISYPGAHFTLDYLLFRLATFYKFNSALSFYESLRRRRLLNQSLMINLHDIMFVAAQKQ